MSRFKFHFKRTLHRKQLRLPGYDYAKEGSYFVTIDCKYMECHFGTIVKQEMILSDFGKIAYDEWLKLPFRFNNVQLDVFQIMPNHMHAIISLIDPSSVRIAQAYGYRQAGAGGIDKYNAREGLNNAREGINNAGAEEDLNNAGASPATTDSDPGASISHVKVGLASTFGINPRAPTFGINPRDPTFGIIPSAPTFDNISDNITFDNILDSATFGINPRDPTFGITFDDHTFGKTIYSPNSNIPLFDIIGSYKSIVANACLDHHKLKHAGKERIPFLGKIWHRSFYDHIIRDKYAYKAISRYILNNPKNWARDKSYRG